MDSQTLVFSFLIFTNLSIFVAATDYPTRCPDNGNYTLNSTYSTNLSSLLSSLPSNMGDSGFYNASLGQNADQIYAPALCRSDIQLNTCRSCVENATAYLVNHCPNRKQALVWVEVCMVRYSNESFFGIPDSVPVFYLWNLRNVTSQEQFNKDLTTLVEDLLNQAASDGSLMKFAVGNRTGPDFQTIYALLQCTPDIDGQDCMSCLTNCAQSISRCCNNSQGVRTLVPSCNLRYEIYPFYNITRFQEAQRILSAPPTLTPLPVPMPVSVPPGRGDRNITRTVIIVVVPIISFLVILACFGAWLRNRMKKKTDGVLASENEISTKESLRYEFNQIREATNNFSIDNKLGEGGFGVVYKGKLQNGQEIAAKRLLGGSAQGDMEFQNEVILLAKLQHRNLVRLVGFAQEQKERILIYEFIQNASLDHFIFDPTKARSIDWNSRLKIILGIAKGLLYLHEDSRLRVIHRDLKPSNILLDRDMNPKIADFGMARLSEHDQSEDSTSKIAGTFGYMAPEYAIKGHFSVKSDVFSFGVLVLEIIMGKKNNHFKNGDTTVEESLLNFAWKNWQRGTITNLMNPMLRSTPGRFHEITRCVHIALLCIQENASDRPTMSSVVLMLSSFTMTLPLPSNPAFFVSHTLDVNDMDSKEHASSNSADHMLTHTSPLSENQVSVTEELYPR